MEKKHSLGKAICLLSIIQKIIYQHLDDNDLKAADRWMDRYNTVHRYGFPGMKDLTLGQMVDEYIQDRVFESRM